MKGRSRSRAKERNGALQRVLLGEAYLDPRAGRVVRVVDSVPAAGEPVRTVVVEAADRATAERWPCPPDRLIPASAGAGSAALLAIAHRLVDRGERLLKTMDLRSAAGAFASASLALEILAGELRLQSAAAVDGATSSGGQRRP